MRIPLSRHEMELADRNHGQAAGPKLHPEVVLTILIVALEFSHKATFERMTEARRPAMFTSSACHRAKRRPPVKE
jgi:hypothetical protein